MASIFDHPAWRDGFFYSIFERMGHICFNGKLLSEDDPVLLASNRSYRYGEGLFETIKRQNARLLLKEYHFDRLFAGLALLRYGIPVHFTRARLEEDIHTLCRKNNCLDLARIRLSVFPGNGGLYEGDRSVQYIIECGSLEQQEFNENGLVIGTYPDARKNMDVFANLKSSGFQLYSMAAIYAREQKWNDCLVLNQQERIADSTIANLFIIKDEVVSTPALAEGCINGVMRRHLLDILPREGYILKETSLQVSDIGSADEIFLSNAIRGVRWVGRFGDKLYANGQSRKIYQLLSQTMQE